MPTPIQEAATEKFARLLVLIVFFSLSLPFIFTAPAKAGGPAAGRFFIMGDGILHIKNSKTGLEADVHLYSADGSPNESSLNKIDDVFGFPTKEKGEHISLRLLSMLDYFSDRAAPGKTINLDSGYRSPRYNTGLRNAGGNVAKTSEHMDGMALDFNLKGVDGRKLWEMVKEKNCCGVGYYGGADIHLDSGRPRFWQAATSKVRTGASDYNRKIYLSTNFDRYQAGERARLSLSSISDFSFGVEATVSIMNKRSEQLATAKIKNGENVDCIPIDNRKTSHFLYIDLPADLPKGRYQIKMDFCDRPFGQMPTATLSNTIEILGGTAEGRSH